jgi:hypothetical protein
MKFINLTPHDIVLIGDEIHTLVPKSGVVARRKSICLDEQPIFVEGTEIKVSRRFLGPITDLPDPKPGIIYITSHIVAEAAQRADVMSPGELVIDDDGNTTGARGLYRHDLDRAGDKLHAVLSETLNQLYDVISEKPKADNPTA